MKIKLLKELRKKNPIYKRGKEYKYICKFPEEVSMPGGVITVNTYESDWTTNLKTLLILRRDYILKYARLHYKKYKRKL